MKRFWQNINLRAKVTGMAPLGLMIALIACQARTLDVNFRSKVPNASAESRILNGTLSDAWSLIKKKSIGDVTLLPIVQKIERSTFLLTLESINPLDPSVVLWKKALQATSEKNGHELLVSLQCLDAILEKIIASLTDKSIDKKVIAEQLTTLINESFAKISAVRRTLNRMPILSLEEVASAPLVGIPFSIGKVVLTDPDTDTPSFNYQWQVSSDGGKTFVEIKDANTAQFQPTLAQAHTQIRCVVTTDDGWGGRASLTSKNLLVQNSLPILKNAVAILGTLEPSTTASIDLTSQTTDADGDLVTATLQWQFSEDGLAFVDIPGMTTKDFAIEESFKHLYLRCKISLSDSYQGSTVAYTQIQQVANRSPDDFIATATAVDIAQVGRELVCAGTTLDPDDDALTYSFRWETSADAGLSYQEILGASAARYTLTLSGMCQET